MAAPTANVCQSNIREIAREGVSGEELLHVYDKWASTYDEDMLTKLEQGAHGYVAEQVADLFREDVRSGTRILDVGAGTGLLGQKLHDAGFTHLEALDPSRKMLDIAMSKNIYEHVYHDYITSEPLNIEAGTYGVVVGVGMLGHNHAPFDAMHEMARLTKPGGYVVLAIRRWYLVSDPGYSAMEPTMDSMETAGKWKRVLRSVFPNYFTDNEGVLFVFQVL